MVVQRARRSLTKMPVVRVGSKPVDGGYFIMDGAERRAFIKSEPKAAPLIRPFVGGNEHINGVERWILILRDVAPKTLRSMPAVMKLVDLVRRYRLGEIPARRKEEHEIKESSALSKQLANSPTEFHVTVLPTESFLVIPEVSSERREYLPIAWLTPPVVPSNKLLIALNVELYHFALIISKMHMAWTEYVGGRLESRYQYSPGINYNPFPWPSLDESAKARFHRLAQSVLDARAAHPNDTLADLYDPNVMPADLRKAHRALDLAVDKLYRAAPFGSDRERVEHLFGLYEKLIAPLAAAAAARPKTGRTRRNSSP